MTAFLALIVMLWAATASAQSAFVQGSAAADIRRLSGEPGTTVFDGTAGALAVAVGGHVMPHWLVGAELDVGGQSSTSTITSVIVSGAGRDIHHRYTSRRRGVSALVGYATSLHRGVQLVYYLGLSFSTFRREITSDAADIVLQAPAPTSIYTDRLSSAIVGVDAAIRVSPHFAVVPGIRAQGLPLAGDLGGHSIRPSIGARISF